MNLRHISAGENPFLPPGIAPALSDSLSTVKVGEMLAFPGSSSRRCAKHLSIPTADLIRNIATVLDGLLNNVLDKQTAAEFEASRSEVFPKYFDAIRALSDLMRIVVPKDVLETIAREAFTEMENDFRHRGLEIFGAAILEQALFTVWTFRKISLLAEKINRTPVPDDLKETDRETSIRFAVTAVWARFHLDCLGKSMKLQRPLHPNVLEAVMDGMRAAVNAYAWIRKGQSFRTVPSNCLFPETADWDDEDQELLDESKLDVTSDRW